MLDDLVRATVNGLLYLRRVRFILGRSVKLADLLVHFPAYNGILIGSEQVLATWTISDYRQLM